VEDPLVGRERGQSCGKPGVCQVIEINDEERYGLDENLLARSSRRVNSRCPGTAILVRTQVVLAVGN
jgi:hypothetical protein